MSEEEVTTPVTITIQIPDQRLRDVMCGAVEGGSNYWIDRADRLPCPEGVKRPTYLFDHVFDVGVRFHYNDGDPSSRVVTAADVRRGVQIMADKYPRHFMDLYRENDDAETSDVLLQCAIFGEIVFG